MPGIAAAFGEVQFFFQLNINNREETVALISVFGNPDPHLLQESSGALIVCEYRGNNFLEIIPVKAISTCIAMIPFTNNPEDNLFFICNKMGLDVAFLGGAQEVEEDDYDDFYV
jgi:hypothetical protein